MGVTLKIRFNGHKKDKKDRRMSYFKIPNLSAGRYIKGKGERRFLRQS